MDCGIAQEQADNFLAEAVHDENAMPSPTEDREIEELLSYLETDETHSVGRHQNNASVPDAAYRHSTLDTISDDEDYDRLFMEVMADNGGTIKGGMCERQGWCEAQEDPESSMDLS